MDLLMGWVCWPGVVPVGAAVNLGAVLPEEGLDLL